jgi:Asp-tRNA(Asn)/Glu-tRNA(Gln) amidotransferase C subunit
MAISKETLRKMLNEIGGVEMSETELEAALPTVQSYAELVDKLRQLDLSEVPAARLVRHDAGRGNDVR